MSGIAILKNNQHSIICFALGLAIAMSAISLRGQTPEPLNWTAPQDHQNMIEQLGIKAIRPAPSDRAGARHLAIAHFRATLRADRMLQLPLREGQRPVHKPAQGKRRTSAALGLEI